MTSRPHRGPIDAAVRAIEAEIHGYLPENAYVVRMPLGSAVRAQQLREVRSVSYYHPAFRLEAALRFELQAGADITRRYNIVVVDKRRDKPGLARQITAVGGRVDDMVSGSLLLQATLTSAQLLRVARLDEVLWIDRWGAPEDDMDNARIQGGGNYVESVGGYTGRGIIGHQYEGLEAGHRDWNNRPIGYPSGCAGSSSHGHNPQPSARGRDGRPPPPPFLRRRRRWPRPESSLSIRRWRRARLRPRRRRLQNNNI